MNTAKRIYSYALRLAKVEIKATVREQGLRLYQIEARDILRIAREHVHTNPKFIAKAKQELHL